MIAQISRIGLSLAASSPAAAWYFLCIVCHFCAPHGAKMTYKELKTVGKRKSYFIVCRFLPSRWQKTTDIRLNMTHKRKSYRIYAKGRGGATSHENADC